MVHPKFCKISIFSQRGPKTSNEHILKGKMRAKWWLPKTRFQLSRMPVHFRTPAPDSGLRTPASGPGLRTPASGLRTPERPSRTPASGLRLPDSGYRTPASVRPSRSTRNPESGTPCTFRNPVSTVRIPDHTACAMPTDIHLSVCTRVVRGSAPRTPGSGVRRHNPESGGSGFRIQVCGVRCDADGSGKRRIGT